MNESGAVDTRLMSLLACPRDHSPLHAADDALCCAHGHRYPVVGGIPVFLLAEAEPTIGIAAASLHAAENRAGAPLFVETIAVSDAERRGILRDWKPGAPVDAAISYLVGATCGRGYAGYAGCLGRVGRYPIPDMPLPRGDGRLLIDIGCSWGRWSVAAARKGWRPVGLDPSLGALAAARRAFAGHEPPMHLVCGDARHLPFKAAAFDAAFSYSVLQHLSEPDADAALAEIGRVLASGGIAKIQMAHAGGLRSRHIMRRKDDAADAPFRVRYWPLDRLSKTVARRIGPARLTPEAFGGLGLLASDRSLVSARARLMIVASSLMKALARLVPALIRIADSVYVEAAKR